MVVDGQESSMVTTVGDGTTLDVEGKLYLGGLPSDYRARNIGNVSSVFCMGLILLWLCLFSRGTCLCSNYLVWTWALLQAANLSKHITRLYVVASP